MMNPKYHLQRMRDLLDEFKPSRERSLAATKLDECEMWLARCTPTAEALGRDLAASAPGGEEDNEDAEPANAFMPTRIGGL